MNTFATDASGTLDLATGSSSVNIQLALAGVHLTLSDPTACPECVDGACNSGDNAGGACDDDQRVSITSARLPAAHRRSSSRRFRWT